MLLQAKDGGHNQELQEGLGQIVPHSLRLVRSFSLQHGEMTNSHCSVSSPVWCFVTAAPGH
jgi:hypothetical protein